MAAARVLVVNAGSSSLKLRVLGAGRGRRRGSDDDVSASADLPAVGGGARRRRGQRGDQGGDRVVRPGRRGRAPDRARRHALRRAGAGHRQVRRRLESLTDLAPLHQPKSLAALDAVTSVLPDIPAVACFDTAFHATIPEAAATFALPAEWRTRWTLRRYGFHGLSHSYVSRRAAELSGTRRRTRRPGCGLSPATWGRARPSPPCWPAGRWTPPWGSPRSTAW